MPARIVVESGASAGAEFTVEDEVFRLGSGQGCKLRLSDPDVPEHAATVEYRGGRYHVYNRGTRRMELESKPVADRASREWLTGQRLTLAPGVVLRLEVHGNPEPVKLEPVRVKAEQFASDESPQNETPLEEEKKRKARQWQWVAVVLCGLLLVWVLMESPGGDGPSPSPGPGLNSIIAELKKQEGESAGPDALWRLLEQARLEELRGAGGEAVRNYRRVVFIVRQRHPNDLAGASDAERQAEKFARRRLAGE